MSDIHREVSVPVKKRPGRPKKREEAEQGRQRARSSVTQDEIDIVRYYAQQGCSHEAIKLFSQIPERRLAAVFAAGNIKLSRKKKPPLGKCPECAENLQDPEWLRSYVQSIVEDFAWRINTNKNTDLQLTSDEMQKRFDSRLCDLMNKLRLFLNKSIKLDGDYPEMIRRFETIADALTETTISQAEPSEPEPQPEPQSVPRTEPRLTPRTEQRPVLYPSKKPI